MLKHYRLFSIAAPLLALFASASGADPPDGNPRTAYFTVGDAQDLLEFPPLDSRASIAAAFETLDVQWQVSRIWWRGGQDEVWGERFVIRPENRGFAKIWDYWRDLQYRKVGTNKIAVEEAHKRGQKIDLTYGLFDNGSQADAGYSGYPYAVEDKLRVDHPEWAPVNRWGTWRQGGPIEFAYPEAREAMSEYLAYAVLDGDYDGIAFLTYAENFSQRYEDEFGYGQPIVDEFKKRHGQDIRKQDFDREAWRQLRGEHVTKFLRLLKTKLAPSGKRVAVMVDGKNPAAAALWNVDGGVRTAGNFRWSIEEWLKGDVVDEICLSATADEAMVERMRKRIAETQSPVTLTVFRSRGPLPEKTPRVMFLGREIESGYESDHWIDYPDEKLTPEPIASLDGDDVHARRRVLTLAMKGKLALTGAQWSKAVADTDLYVRRTALRGIAAIKPAGAQAAVTKALADPETTVRCLAALALAEIGDEASLAPVLAAAFELESPLQYYFRATPDALKRHVAREELAAKVKAALVSRLSDDAPHVRERTLHYFTLIGAPATPDVEAALHKILQEDASEYSRELAIVNLRSSFGPTKGVVDRLRRVASGDSSHAVQNRAACALATMGSRAGESDPFRKPLLDEAVTFFRQYGDDSKRTDREWGWRPLGAILAEFGPAGEKALRDLMAETKDRTLSDRAWRILHLKQGDGFFRVTEEEDEAAHKRHPWWAR